MKVDARKLLTGIAAENTIQSYETSWSYYLEFAGSVEKALDGAMLTRWRQELCAGKGSASAINTRLAGIKTIFRELYNHRLISREVYWDSKEVKKLSSTAFKERKRPNNRVRIEPEQMRMLCKAPVITEDDHVTLRDRALMMVLATTGARISEVLAMRVRDIYSPSEGAYAIANVVGKNHADPRDVPLSPEAYSAVMDWIAFRPVQSPYIFSSYSFNGATGSIDYSDQPMSRNIALSRIKVYGRQVGMPDIKCHDFRRFVGTQLAKKDIRLAQKVLGHANIGTTVSHYVLDDFTIGSTDNIMGSDE